MPDKEAWKKFDSVKSWDVKTRTIESLVYTGEPETFKRICREFINTNSIQFKDTAIKIIEILADKFKAEENIDAFPLYAELLKKYKVENVVNFNYRDFKKVTPAAIFSMINEDILKNKEKIETKSLRLSYILPETNHMRGIVMIHIWHNILGSRFDNITYGCITDLRDYSKDRINEYPIARIMDQKMVDRKSGLFKKGKFPEFTLHKSHENEMKKFFNILPGLFENFAQTTPDGFDSFLSKFPKEYHFLSDDLFLILGFVNVNVYLERFDLAKEFGKIALEKLEPNGRGSAWIDYFKKWA